MELLAIILSGLITLVSPVGLILDRTLAKAVRESVTAVDQLAVRVDNAPSYRILQGKVERVRIASRGVKLAPNLKIHTLELEMDPIADLSSLSTGTAPENLGSRQPLQGAMRLVFTEEDINLALQSQQIKAKLEELLNGLIPIRGSSPTSGYELLNLRFQLLDNNRLSFQVGLSQSGDPQSEQLDLMLESGVEVVAGRSLQLLDPKVSVNGRPISSRLIASLTNGLIQRFDLRQLENEGITARLLQFDLVGDRVDLAAFIRFESASLP